MKRSSHDAFQDAALKKRCGSSVSLSTSYSRCVVAAFNRPRPTASVLKILAGSVFFLLDKIICLLVFLLVFVVIAVAVVLVNSPVFFWLVMVEFQQFHNTPTVASLLQ